MKIYNEIVIDMNPESSSYGKTLHEDSCNYTGDIMLCRTASEVVKAPTGLKGLTEWLRKIKAGEISPYEGTGTATGVSEVICGTGEVKDEQSGLCIPFTVDSGGGGMAFDIDPEGNIIVKDEIVDTKISDEEAQDYFDEYGHYPEGYDEDYEEPEVEIDDQFITLSERASTTLCPDGRRVPHASYCEDVGYDWHTPTEWFEQEDVDVPDWYDTPGGQDEFENYIYNYYKGQTNLNKEDWLDEFGGYFTSFEDRPEYTEFVLKLKQIGLHEQGREELHQMNILNLHEESLDYLDRLNEATLKTGGKQLAWNMESGYKERGGGMGGRSIEAVKDIVAMNNRELTANLVREHLDVDIIKEGYDDKLYSWEDQQLSLEGQLAGIQTSYQNYLDSMFIANPSLGYDFKNDDGRVDTEEEICDSMTAQTWCNATSECCLPNQVCSTERGCYFPDNNGDGGNGLHQSPNGLEIKK